MNENDFEPGVIGGVMLHDRIRPMGTMPANLEVKRMGTFGHTA